VVLVFDGYRVPGNRVEKREEHGIRVVYTEENETGDAYIERLVQEIGKNEQVRVVTSDNLIRLAAARSGVLRMNAGDFEEEVSRVSRELGELLKKQTAAPSRVGEAAKITALPGQSDLKE
jgi:predicted RNA-binding protein with PIN domain